MADDEDELEEELDEIDDVDPDDVDPDEVDEDFAEGDDFDDDSFDDDDEDDDGQSAPAATDDDDDDDEEPDPDDVEEDLDTILRDKIASGEDLDEDDEDDEDKVVAPVIEATEGDKVAPKRENEWTCEGCFLIVSSRQFGRKESATCPSGQPDCPSLKRL